MKKNMNTQLDCIPCLIRQSVEVARLVSDDELLQKQIIENTLRIVAEQDYSKSPPALAQIIHRVIREISGVTDPYKNAKKEFNRLALSMLEEFSEQIDSSPDPLHAAVKLAVAGNVIDSGAKTGLCEADIRSSVEKVFDEKFAGDIADFCKQVSDAKNILYLADNAGEIFFDRLLIEKLGHLGITLAVRGYPILNDAVMEDALEAGIDRFAAIITNGADVPGTILEECSHEFLEYYKQADLIISKGQGNYETLCDEKKNIYFLFKVKCQLVADHVGLPVGSHAVIRSAGWNTG